MYLETNKRDYREEERLYQVSDCISLLSSVKDENSRDNQERFQVQKYQLAKVIRVLETIINLPATENEEFEAGVFENI